MSAAILVILAALNLHAFLLMGYDKRCARQRKRRVSEKRLFLAAACFGALGGALAMQVFRHKTKHWQFRLLFPAMLAGQMILLALLF